MEMEKMVTLKMTPDLAALVIALLERVGANLSEDEDGYWRERSDDWKCSLTPNQFSNLLAARRLVEEGLERAGYRWAGREED